MRRQATPPAASVIGSGYPLPPADSDLGYVIEGAYSLDFGNICLTLIYLLRVRRLTYVTPDIEKNIDSDPGNRCTLI